jgi:RNA-directed DNA polymerase
MKPWYWQKARDWGRLNPQRRDTWVLGDKHTGALLLKFSWFRIRRHALVRGTASPDDPALRTYWQARAQAKVHTLPPRQQRLARTQSNVCEVCGDSLSHGEPLHIHHRVPKVHGGQDEARNLTLLHLYCHQQVHHVGNRCEASEQCVAL